MNESPRKEMMEEIHSDAKIGENGDRGERLENAEERKDNINSD